MVLLVGTARQEQGVLILKIADHGKMDMMDLHFIGFRMSK